MEKNLTFKEVIEIFSEHYNPEEVLTLVIKSKFETNAKEIENKLTLFKECVKTIEIELDGEKDEERIDDLEGVLAFFLRLTASLTLK